MSSKSTYIDDFSSLLALRRVSYLTFVQHLTFFHNGYIDYHLILMTAEQQMCQEIIIAFQMNTLMLKEVKTFFQVYDLQVAKIRTRAKTHIFVPRSANFFFFFCTNSSSTMKIQLKAICEELEFICLESVLNFCTMYM